jgi:hypothetical protein
MTNVMEPGPARRRTRCEAGATDQSVEGVLDVGVKQPGARRGEEQRRRASPPRRSIRSVQIVVESVHAARMQRQLAGFAELSVADGEQAADRIEVIAVEANRFPNPHPGHRQQGDQSPIGRYPV